MPLPQIAVHLHQRLQPRIATLLSPAILGRIATSAPLAINRLAVESLLNRLFAEQNADGDFEFLRERALQVEIGDAGVFVGLSYRGGRITCWQFGAQRNDDADATLSIDTYSAIQLVQQEVDPDTLFFQRKLKISGNTELAHQVKNTIDTLDPEIIPAVLQRLLNSYRTGLLEGERYQKPRRNAQASG